MTTKCLFKEMLPFLRVISRKVHVRNTKQKIENRNIKQKHPDIIRFENQKPLNYLKYKFNHAQNGYLQIHYGHGMVNIE